MEELNTFQQSLKTILEKQRSPWITPLLPHEMQMYKAIYPDLIKAANELFKINSEAHMKRHSEEPKNENKL